MNASLKRYAEKGLSSDMDKKFLKTYFICAAGTLLIAFSLFHFREVASLLQTLLMAFRPVLIGALAALVLNRPYEKLKKLLKWLFRRLPQKAVNLMVLALLYLLLAGIVTLILLFVLPQLYASISGFVENINGYYENIRAAAEKALTFGGHDWWQELRLEEKLGALTQKLPGFLEKAFTGLMSALSGIIGTVTDSVIGIVISIYGLQQKERLAGHATRLMKALFRPQHCRGLTDFFTVSARTFSQFFSGQLTEAGILGVLCFAGMTLFGFEYAILISVITAVSNLIPLVGPIVGAVPSTLILLLVKPSQALWFLVLLIILQQLEANLIYPKVVGGSVGLPAIWVLISVVVGGSLLGITGMLFAIPAVSVLYQYIRRYVNKKYGPPKTDPPQPKQPGKEKTIVIEGNQT